MDFCPNLNMLAVSEKTVGEKRLVVRLRCKMWTCEYCAKINKAQWRAILIHHIANSEFKWCWFTITAHRYARGEQKSLANLRGAWDKLMKRIKRKFGKISYARVYEQHEDGSYHIHAIASFHFGDIKLRKDKRTGNFVPYSHWLKKTAWELGIGMYTHAEDIDEVSSEKALNAGYAASYITKYIVKLQTAQKADFGRIRHIQTSQNWLRKEYKIDNEWQLRSGIYYEDILKAWENNYRFFDIKLNYLIDIDDFEDTYIYPREFDYRIDKVQINGYAVSGAKHTQQQ